MTDTGSASGRDSAEDVARWMCDAGVASACAVGWSRRNGARGWSRGTGGRVSSLFDLASVTKPMTAFAVVRAGFSIDDPLGIWLEEARGTPSEHAPIELLLSHRAGLVDHVPLFSPLVTGGAIDQRASLVLAAQARRDDARGPFPRDGFAPVYSDLGYALAGEALARREGVRDAGEAIESLVSAPLASDRVLGTARGLEARGVDVRNIAEPTERVAWRGGDVRGRVHDENAWALFGDGGGGHAGIFGTIDAVLDFACAAADAIARAEGPLASENPRARDLRWMTRERPGGTLRAGWDGKSDEGSSAGTRMGPRAFGHLGFTGTSVWIDPDREIVVSVLTNRVHPTRENIAIRSARPVAHDRLFAIAEAETR